MASILFLFQVSIVLLSQVLVLQGVYSEACVFFIWPYGSEQNSLNLLTIKLINHSTFSAEPLFAYKNILKEQILISE